MKNHKQVVLLLLLSFWIVSSTCAKTEVTKQSGGKLPNGDSVARYTLKDEKVEVQVITYGGDLVAIKVPDRTGNVEDIVLGFDDSSGYYENNHSKNASFFGPIVGRYANRIAHAKFTLDGKEYNLPKNNGDNSIHGGPNGFHNHIWQSQAIENGVELKYLSMDGEEGYPGSLSVTVRYTLEGGDLKIDYAAATNKATVLNLTNHSYFNLSGQGHGTILNEQLKLNATQHRRSLNKEVIVCLERALRTTHVDTEAFLTKARAIRRKTSRMILTDQVLIKARNEGRP